MTETVTVLLVDDHPIVRQGLRAVLGHQPGVEVIAEAATGEEALELSRTLHPDVVLCDLRLGDGMDGVQTTVALREQSPAPAVIILTTYDHDVDIVRAVEAGAAGYLLKDVSPTAIVAALTDAAAGRMVLAPEMARRVVEGMRHPRARLTQRELEVLGQLATGAGNREIARALFVTEATVKTHLVNIFGKVGAESRTEAVARARELGYL